MKDQTIYPRNIELANFDWDAFNFKCPCCYNSWKNDAFSVFECCHVLCIDCHERLANFR
jgi:hypothetical protein